MKNINEIAQEVRNMYERDVLEIRRAVVTAQSYYNMYKRTGARKYAFACEAECRKARTVMRREEAAQTKLYDDIQWLGPRGLIVAMGYRRVVYPHIAFLCDAEEVICGLEDRMFYARKTGKSVMTNYYIATEELKHINTNTYREIKSADMLNGNFKDFIRLDIVQLYKILDKAPSWYDVSMDIWLAMADAVCYTPLPDDDEKELKCAVGDILTVLGEIPSVI